MKTNRTINKIIITGLLILFSLVVSFKISSAQEYNAILTWEADSFYPADYKGKPPAVPNSSVSVSATVMESGRIINTSNSEFVWYLNNKFFKKGVGLNEVMFDVDKSIGSEYFLRVKINTDEKNIEKSVAIPVSDRELVIDNPRPSNLIKLGERVVLEAIPYFFNVTSLDYLSFFWSMDNVLKKDQKTNSLILDIGTSDSLRGADMLITGQVANRNKPTESAKSNLRLIIR